MSLRIISFPAASNTISVSLSTINVPVDVNVLPFKFILSTSRAVKVPTLVIAV